MGQGNSYINRIERSNIGKTKKGNKEKHASHYLSFQILNAYLKQNDKKYKMYNDYNIEICRMLNDNDNLVVKSKKSNMEDIKIDNRIIKALTDNNIKLNKKDGDRAYKIYKSCIKIIEKNKAKKGSKIIKDCKNCIGNIKVQWKSKGELNTKYVKNLN